MEESLSHIRVHVSAILAWAIASAESCLAGSSRIEPVHFLIAVLKVIDDAYHAEARDMGFDRAFPPGTRTEAVIYALNRDFAARAVGERIAGS